MAPLCPLVDSFGAHRAQRLVFYENLFFMVDHDSNGYLTKDQTFGLLSFIAIETSRANLEKVYRRFDNNGDNFITQEEARRGIEPEMRPTRLLSPASLRNR